jgi:hypothetical protein
MAERDDAVTADGGAGEWPQVGVAPDCRLARLTGQREETFGAPSLDAQPPAGAARRPRRPAPRRARSSAEIDRASEAFPKLGYQRAGVPHRRQRHNLSVRGLEFNGSMALGAAEARLGMIEGRHGCPRVEAARRRLGRRERALYHDAVRSNSDARPPVRDEHRYTAANHCEIQHQEWLEEMTRNPDGR